VYKGVDGLLSRLEATGVRKAIASNKPLHQIVILAEKFGFTPRFDLILGPEKVDRGKPEPDMFLKCAEHLRLPREAFLIVGDTDLDMIAGKRAGMKRAAALWGYSTREKLAQFGPEYFVEEPEQLIDIIA
jgi:phosphoglycolate phosphatase